MNNVSFVLKAPLVTPVLMSNGYITLDGMLAVAHEMMTGRPATPADIPLAEESGIKKGSAAFFTLAGPSSRITTKTMFRRLQSAEMREIPDQALPRRGGRYIIEQASGEFCAATTEFVSIEADCAYWFGVGDPDRVVDLMRCLPGVGRKASLGNGAFENGGETISVEEVPDCSFSLYGKPSRPIPVSMWKGADAQRAVVSVSHPYWESPRVPCVVPVTRILTKRDLMPAKVMP